MRKILFVISLLIYCSSCSSQVQFETFTQEFESLELPINRILDLAAGDTLNGVLTNNITIRKQKDKPQIINKDGKYEAIKQYYGLYPEEPDSYLQDIEKDDGSFEEKRIYFQPKIISAGRINLNSKYQSLIIKVVGYETTFYDLWNFSKEGKALSVICLFWGLRDGGPRDEAVTFTIVDSKVTKEGDVIWHENADGLETFRTYRLNEEGYFKVINEEQKGEAEF
ncbi:hypothetical protein [Labilibaculum euxinus]